MKAVGNTVLVERVSKEKVTGLHAPGNAAIEGKIETTYKIVDFGKSCENPDELKPGDSIMFGEYFKPLGGSVEVIKEEIVDNRKIKIVTQSIIVFYDAIIGII